MQAEYLKRRFEINDKISNFERRFGSLESKT